MARVTVDVPDSIMDEAKAKELQAARKRIKTLEAKIAKLEQTHAKAKEAIEMLRAYRAHAADILDLHLDYYDDF